MRHSCSRRRNGSVPVVPQDAVDALVEVLDLEPIEVNIFRGVSPKEAASGSSAARSPARRWSPRPARSRPTAGSTRCSLLPAGRRPARAGALRGRAAARRRVVHHPAGGRPSSTARSSSTCRPASRCPRRASTTPPCRTCRRPTDSPPCGAAEPLGRGRGTVARPAWAHRHPPRRLVGPRAAPATPSRARTCGCGRWPAARRPDPAHHRAHLRLRHDAARHRHPAPRRHLVRPHPFMASLDHAMWFHRPFRADDWLLYAQDSPTASGGGACRGAWSSPGRHAGGHGDAGGLIRSAAVAQTPASRPADDEPPSVGCTGRAWSGRAAEATTR